MNSIKSFTNLNITSNDLANDSSSGSLISNGGIGIKGNIYTGYEMNCKELIVRDSGKIGDSLYICNELCVGEMFQLDKCKKDIIFKKNLIPYKNKRLGNSDHRWDIYGNKIKSYHLDISKSVNLGSNCYQEPLIKIDNCIKDTVFINGNLVINDENCDSLLQIIKKTKDIIIDGKTNINNILKVDQTSIMLKYETITISSSTKILQINSPIILINTISSPINPIEITQINSFKDGTIIKIVLKTDCPFELKVNDKTVNFNTINDYIELMKVDYKLTYIGGNIKPY